jgi:hypothetical protein
MPGANVLSKNMVSAGWPMTTRPSGSLAQLNHVTMKSISSNDLAVPPYNAMTFCPEMGKLLHSRLDREAPFILAHF